MWTSALVGAALALIIRGAIWPQAWSHETEWVSELAGDFGSSKESTWPLT
jgi:hypothetical protein